MTAEVTSGLRSVAKNNSAVDRVTAEIRRGVLNGTLKAGSSFSIVDLSVQLGVSHIPVREALRRLETQGLITLRPGRSAIVNPLDRDELRSIYRLRKLIECDLAARACLDLTSADLDLAERLLMDYTHAETDADELWELHKQFHLTLLRPALTEWDLRLLEQLWHACDRYTRIVFETYQVGQEERRRREMTHRLLLDAARSGSPAELKLAVNEHLAENELACLEWMAALPPTP
ncbi:DNA-binding GntR family transcriptional regulator [Allocatelliglobosispora scoriae]|uniref:DNA-binding GntR family transcriptional regulator n=1 Tax=Allocatelliglobosispora scoriae TaxID=643052 RepID=A0A841C390_9ACTN|nr:GntR family transcriptional regulator [Allocatelliglobosispora scoriae]MBB5873512.1 DNA-binding GntR family transcriptional regulator [Allocatelliglobosispora scoriae]